MVMHQASRKVYLGVGYTWAGFGAPGSYTGANTFACTYH